MLYCPLPLDFLVYIYLFLKSKHVKNLPTNCHVFNLHWMDCLSFIDPKRFKETSIHFNYRPYIHGHLDLNLLVVILSYLKSFFLKFKK